MLSMGLTAIECPDGVCHSHHGGHAVERQTMQSTLESHGKDWCERLAERIYEISVDTFSQSVMPSLGIPAGSAGIRLGVQAERAGIGTRPPWSTASSTPPRASCAAVRSTVCSSRNWCREPSPKQLPTTSGSRLSHSGGTEILAMLKEGERSFWIGWVSSCWTPPWRLPGRT